MMLPVLRPSRRLGAFGESELDIPMLRAPGALLADVDPAKRGGLSTALQAQERGGAEGGLCVKVVPSRIETAGVP